MVSVRGGLSDVKGVWCKGFWTGKVCRSFAVKMSGDKIYGLNRMS